MSLNTNEEYFKTEMYTEILQEPLAITRAIKSVQKNVKDASNILKSSTMLLLTGSGTSYNASLIGEMALINSGIPAISIMSSEFNHFLPRKNTRAAVIIVSQSGEGRELRSVLRISKKKGYKTIGITNEDESFLSKNSDVSIATDVGREVCIPATKTFMAEIVALQILISELISKTNYRSKITRIAKIADDVSAIIKKSEYLIDLSSKIHGKIVLLGNGYLHPVAMEGATKLGETTGLATEAFPIGEYLHGPIRSLSEDDTVIMLRGNDSMEIRRVARKLEKYCQNLITIGTESDDDIRVPTCRYPDLQPLIYVVPLQLLANFRAVSMGLNPDNPPRLNKIVK